MFGILLMAVKIEIVGFGFPNVFDFLLCFLAKLINIRITAQFRISHN